VFVSGVLVGWGGWMKEIEVTVYGRWISYTYWNRTKKPLAIPLGKIKRGLKGREDEGNVNNIQYKNHQYDPPV
jgi:hypothetical protein